MNWQPIETAPKNMTPVIIYSPSWGGEILFNYYREDLGGGNVFYSPNVFGPTCVRDATHWRPMLKPPATNKED